MPKATTLETEKRIRIVMEWILEDWPTCDIIAQCQQKGWCDWRQAKRYIAEAKKLWLEDDRMLLEHKRKLRVAALKRRQRSLRAEFKGTPQGLRAITAIEAQIIKLEGLDTPTKIEVKSTLNLKDLPITFE